MPEVDRLVKTRLPTKSGSGRERARGLVSNRASGQRVEACSYAPPDDLTDVVLNFWRGSWDLRSESPHTTELLSDPCLHIVFEDAGPHRGSRLVGAWTKIWRRTLSDQGLVRGVKIRAGGARAFVDDSIHQFTDKITPLADVFVGDAGDLEAAVLGARHDEEAFDILGNWLREIRIRKQDAQVKLAINVCSIISKDLTITSVEELTQASGLSKRVLQRLFRNYVGGTPKWAILRNRLQEAALLLERGEAGGLAALAADLGFTDQSHFAHDFKRATGKTPAYFRETVNRADALKE